MSSTRTPNHSVLESFLQGPVDLVTYFLNRRFVAYDESLAEVRLVSFSSEGSALRTRGSGWAIPLRVDTHQLQLLPAPLYDVLNPQVELAAHDHRVGLSGQLVKEVEADRVYLVIDVQTGSILSTTDDARDAGNSLPLDILSMVFHDNINEVVYRC